MKTTQRGRGSFISVSIPESLIVEIDKILEKEKLGYQSRPEFIKEAVRKRLEELKTLERMK
jgi:metal-responsive CopG/Arc/MetJ family transcriptional regulator